MARAPDPDGLRYARYWEPVLAGATGRLLERIEVEATGRSHGPPAAMTLLDLGAGTGSLAFSAAERWPQARIVAVDASAGMLSVARHRVAERWPDEAADRFGWLAADASSVPLDDASVDVVASSFMLQLVPDRRAVLREAWRVLRPGGVLGFVTWMADELSMAADIEFDEAVYDLGLDDPEAARSDDEGEDYESTAEAQSDLDAVGFEDAIVRQDRLQHAWAPAEYRTFKEEYDERDLFESLAAADRARLRRRVDERWSGLPDEAFVLDAPLISVTARRPRLRGEGR
jgi:SAM-dependent methyltransferase